LKTETGQPQYHVSEIFVAAEDPSKMGEARKFTETVIEQLHRGVAFGIAAAQFSQSETALTGGDLGWVSPDQLDPQVAALIHEMPIGAVSNPIPVAGGYSIVTVREKRLVGQDMANVLTLHQAFFPFTTALDPQAPTDQQKGALAAAGNLSKTAHDCGVLDAANKAQGEKRPTDPGPVREDRLNPHMRQIISALAIGQPSQPLVTPEGILVVMVCKREQKNMAVMTREDIANQLLQERVELSSRQLLQDLKRRALIDMHS
jgi:peptidyl-prolyl cis-trans isomerase SurA